LDVEFQISQIISEVAWSRRVLERERMGRELVVLSDLPVGSDMYVMNVRVPKTPSVWYALWLSIAISIFATYSEPVLVEAPTALVEHFFILRILVAASRPVIL
jgi:hypothetical protein